MDTKMLFFDIDGTLITEEDGKNAGQYKRSTASGT